MPEALTIASPGLRRSTLFFALAAPGTAAHFVPASGGTLEPLLYLPLLWALRMPGCRSPSRSSWSRPSARLLANFLASGPQAEKHLIARELEARGVKYASSDYWLAYALTFLTSERVIVASEDLVRIEECQRLVGAHRDEAVSVSRHACDGAGRFAAASFCVRLDRRPSGTL